MITDDLMQTAIKQNVEIALSEDIGGGDITAQLISADSQAQAVVKTRQSMLLAGRPWVDALFASLDPNVELVWHKQDGDLVHADEVFLSLSGNARSLLTGERASLNFIQTLSAVATTVQSYVAEVSHTHTKILDTRKTLPGLRIAQKYAVTIGGGKNHRLGLFDAFLIKENHILAAGSIAAAVAQARQIAPNKPVEVEVENQSELTQALAAGSDIVMLDNFSLAEMKQAVAMTAGQCKLEASGNMTRSDLKAVAETGVDYISMGTITKDIAAIDLSMRLK